jgi:hypothetical protein
MIGLGVLATGSGAAALTGATLSNTVNPTADFRVNVQGDNLVIERHVNSTFDGNTNVDTTGNDISSSTLVYEDGGGSTLNDSADFAAAANKQANGNLEFGVLVPYDEIPTSDSKTGTSGSVTYRFPHLLQVTNNSGGTANIVVRYDDQSGGGSANNNGYVTSDDNDIDGDGTFVSASGSGTELSYDEVASIFEISAQDGGNDDAWTRISPTGAWNDQANKQDPDAAATLGDGNKTSLAVTVNLDNDFGDKIANEVEAQQLDANGGQIRFLDQVWFSTTGSPGNDTTTGSSFNATTF